MNDWVQVAIPRIRVALALFALTAIVTIPWAAVNWGISPAGLLLLVAWLLVALIALPIARGGLEGRAYWALLIGALVFTRLAAFLLVQGSTLVGDPEIYGLLARSLMVGEGLVFHDPLTEVAFRALYPPVYPLFLAGLGTAIGLGEVTIWISNVAIDLGCGLILIRLGGHAGSKAVGRAAAWLFAVWPAFVFATPFAQKEGLVTLEVLLIAFVLIRLDRVRLPLWRDGAAIGLASGALMLTQPGLALLPAILGLALLPIIGWRPLWGLLLRSLPFALLVLAPWWIRNFHLFGTFVPLTTTGGLGLWVGNNPQATGNWMPMPDSYRGLPELDMSARAAHDALAWITGNPVDFVRLTFFKLFRAMGLEQFTLGRFNLMTPKPDPALLSLLFPLLQGALIALFLGIAAFGQRVRILLGADRLVLILCGCALQLLVFSLPFEFGERHRYFLMPFLFLLLASALLRGHSTNPEPASA